MSDTQASAIHKLRLDRYRAELVSMAEADQDDLIESISHISTLLSEAERRLQGRALFARCHRRAERMIKLLRIIKEPRISQIGRDGSEAILLLAQHAYADIMKEVLASYLFVDTLDPSEVPRQYLPALIDRLLILEKRVQRYGTQWMNDVDEKPFLVQLEDFASVNKQRKEFGLGAIRRPIQHTKTGKRYPLGRGRATEQDQRPLDEATYTRYTENYVRRIS